MKCGGRGNEYGGMGRGDPLLLAVAGAPGAVGAAGVVVDVAACVGVGVGAAAAVVVQLLPQSAAVGAAVAAVIGAAGVAVVGIGVGTAAVAAVVVVGPLPPLLLVLLPCLPSCLPLLANPLLFDHVCCCCCGCGCGCCCCCRRRSFMCIYPMCSTSLLSGSSPPVPVKE